MTKLLYYVLSRKHEERSMIEHIRGLLGVVLAVAAVVCQYAALAVFVVGVAYDYSWVTWTLSHIHPLVLLLGLGMGVSALLMDWSKKIIPK